MKYVDFDQKRPLDIILLGRIAIDFNPAYNEQVKEEFKPLKKVHMFEMFVGGSPANIAVGVTRHGLKAGFLQGFPMTSSEILWWIILKNRESIHPASPAAETERTSA